MERIFRIRGSRMRPMREMMLSLSMMARLTQTIQPRLPVTQSFTGPGAQPLCFARGERMPQPIMAPRSICSVVEVPIMMPWPIYAGEGFSVQSHVEARVPPKIGTSRRTGKKYDTNV